MERKRDMKRDRDSQDRDHGTVGGLGSGVGVVIRLLKGVCGWYEEEEEIEGGGGTDEDGKWRRTRSGGGEEEEEEEEAEEDMSARAETFNNILLK